jgi:hypothetical protein
MPAGDGHFSRAPVARRLKQPTRKSVADRTSPPAAACAATVASCLALLLVGFAEPDRSPGLLVSSYLAVSPLPLDKVSGRFTFCCTFPDLTAGGRYPPPSPWEPGLSSRRAARAARPAAIRSASIRIVQIMMPCPKRKELSFRARIHRTPIRLLSEFDGALRERAHSRPHVGSITIENERQNVAEVTA